MDEFQKGDLVIVNDLVGFVVSYDKSSNKVTLNTSTGTKEVLKSGRYATVATAREIAAGYVKHVGKVMCT